MSTRLISLGTGEARKIDAGYICPDIASSIFISVSYFIQRAKPDSVCVDCSTGSDYSIEADGDGLSSSNLRELLNSAETAKSFDRDFLTVLSLAAEVCIHSRARGQIRTLTFIKDGSSMRVQHNTSPRSSPGISMRLTGLFCCHPVRLRASRYV